LPSWRSVAFARSPYGIFVPEISDVAVLARDMAQGMVRLATWGWAGFGF
jgi:hypothetical protein